MNDKDMVNDCLAKIKASLATYANVIAETNNSGLRSTLQQMREQDEQRQYNLHQVAAQKGYYKPAAPAQPIYIQNVRNELTSPAHSL